MTPPRQTAAPHPPYPVSPAQIASYLEHGHVLIRSLASAEEVGNIRPEIDRVLDDAAAGNDTQGRIDDYSSLFRQVTNVWRMSEAVKEFVCAERFARVAATLMGVRGVRLYHDQALYKPAGGKPTPWHQDQFYWPLDTDRTITMWMPLIDLTRDMGTMLFAGGSHTHGPLFNGSISEESHRLFGELVAEHGWKIQSDDLRGGDATFHAGWTVHSAHPNTSGKVRKVLTVIYFADGTDVAEPSNEFRRTDMEVFLPGCRPGEKAASPLNPLLYSSADV